MEITPSKMYLIEYYLRLWLFFSQGFEDFLNWLKKLIIRVVSRKKLSQNVK